VVREKVRWHGMTTQSLTYHVPGTTFCVIHTVKPFI